jgi:hypothetical protein
LPAPSALALAALSGNEVSFYATTAGMEAAFTLSFVLPGSAPSLPPTTGGALIPGIDSALDQARGQLVALSETSLALVGTLLISMPGTSSASGTSFLVATESQAEANASTALISLAPSQGQSLFTRLETHESGSGEPEETMPEAPQGEGQGQAQGPPRGQGAMAPPWVRSLLSLERLFEEVREEHQEGLPGKDEGEPAVDEETPITPAPQPAEPVRGLNDDDGMSAAAVDAAIDALGWLPRGEGESRRAATHAVLTQVPALRDSASARAATNAPGEPIVMGMLLATTAMLIVRANRWAAGVTERRL